ncbi:hypothetical protein NH340_JMT02887 [Sarcoptes scabiei]|nr:hypothetical protein NH340_JMT02887 [Sarcoptes scabiei]
MDPEKFQSDSRKLLITGFICYLLALIYNLFLVKKSTTIKQICLIVAGLLICIYNFSLHSIHSLVVGCSVWISIKFLGPSKLMVANNFVLSMTYLFYGYYQKYISKSKGFTWTMPQCVLTLSMIALSFDVYDGHISRKKSSTTLKTNDNSVIPMSQDETMIYHTPSLIEILSKIYFPPTFMIGPLLSFKHYLQYIESKQSFLAIFWKQSILRLSIGLIYLLFFKIGQTYLPEEYFFTENFKSSNLLFKLSIIAVANKLILCKYISAWLISEGACILFGVSRNPKTNALDRCCNVSLLHYETTATFRGVIESFNITTNRFVAKYIYKRLKWLKSKTLSQTISLFFLAIWHGLYLGYYNTFALELIVTRMESDIANQVIKLRIKNGRFNQFLNQTSARWIIYVLMRLHVIYTLSYCFLSFAILDYDRWTSVLADIYYCGHFVYSVWFIMSIANYLLRFQSKNAK